MIRAGSVCEAFEFLTQAGGRIAVLRDRQARIAGEDVRERADRIAVVGPRVSHADRRLLRIAEQPANLGVDRSQGWHDRTASEQSGDQFPP